MTQTIIRNTTDEAYKKLRNKLKTDDEITESDLLESLKLYEITNKELKKAKNKYRKWTEMDMEFRTFCWNYAAVGKVEVIYDFDNSGFAYFKSNRDVQNSAFVEVSEVIYLEREAELLAREIARKKESEETE